jgi:hypothetical protein
MQQMGNLAPSANLSQSYLVGYDHIQMKNQDRHHKVLGLGAHESNVQRKSSPTIV